MLYPGNYVWWAIMHLPKGPYLNTPSLNYGDGKQGESI